MTITKILQATLTIEDEHGLTRTVTLKEKEILQRISDSPFYIRDAIKVTLLRAFTDDRFVIEANRGTGSEGPGEHGGNRQVESGTVAPLCICGGPDCIYDGHEIES